MSTIAMLITVDAQDLEDEERDEYAAELARALRELPGAELATVPGPRDPDGSKGVGALLGGLSVTVAASRKALTAVLDVLRRWAAVEAARKLVLEVGGDRVEITGATREQMDRALDLIVDKHSREAD